MKTLPLFGYNYHLKGPINIIKDKFDELFVLAKLLGYTVYGEGHHIILQMEKTPVVRIFIRRKKNSSIQRMEFICNKEIEQKIHSTFSKESKSRKNGFKISFTIDDMKELPPILTLIMNEL